RSSTSTSLTDSLMKKNERILKKIKASLKRQNHFYTRRASKIWIGLAFRAAFKNI
ncbi:Hypothetical protein FKW44_007653, partial [Caligus rogercresseyi]